MKTVYYTHSMNEAELDSSALSAAWYSENDKELYVKFHNGTVAGYGGVPVVVWLGMTCSSSKGRYWANQIKNIYRGVSADVSLVAHASKGIPATANGTLKKVFTNQYKVTVNVTGDLEFTVSAEDIAEAVTAVKHTLDQASGAKIYYKVTKVETA